MKLPKTYDPSQYEENIYALWEKSAAFTPKNEAHGKPYTIVMPPPNANANMHMGHELTAALEDVAARYHRLKGDDVLLLPGADHAGFETQSVYEKHLAKEGKTRFDFSRDELYSQIFDFVALNRSNFETQLRKMGIGCNWNKFTFTLDAKIVGRAHQTFKKMWEQGLIYRGERLVNYCTFHGTGFADVEVVHTEEQGHLWFIRYPLVDGSGDLTIATTRPETLLGDTAVAVNPSDERYSKFVGKTVKLPLTHRELPVIADDFVDTAFGTGAVKITPAHDQNDFEAGKRHDLPLITVITTEGNISHDMPEAYRGLSVLDARKRIVADLEEQGFLVKTEDHTHNVGHCYKCGTVIQPLLREQWFVDMDPLAKEALKALNNNKITFYPAAKQSQLVSYLEGLHDWNISRQIAWGIPIPAFQNIDQLDDWIYDERVTEEIITVGDKTYRRDPDVLDTWFSSSSWPYATLDFPDGDDFKRFYPLSLMETGGEILYPWVSRMIMLGLYVTGEVPFKEVYVHGYVMAEDGSKMSKSIGNVVDPIPVIEQFGSDALRMGIISGRSAAVNRGYDQRKVEEARNFCNKLWNVARFIEDIIGDDYARESVKPITVADHWILHKLQRFQDGIFADLDTYGFSEAYDKLYHFVWDDLADWYIEASKAQPNKPLLAHLLETVLLLAHPFAPFLTETIWQTLAWEGDSLLTTKVIGTVIKADDHKAAAFGEIQSIVTESRFIMNALKASDVTLYYDKVDFIRDNAGMIKRMSRLKGVTEVTDGTGLYLTTTSAKCWLDIDQATAQNYLVELEQKQTRQKGVIAQLEQRLSNKEYVKNAPHAVVAQTKQQLSEAKELLTSIEREHQRFSA